MFNGHRVPSFMLALGALVSLSLAAPAAAQDAQEVLAVPAGPSWDETSGYGAVEGNRAERALGMPMEPSAGAVVDPLRVIVPLDALQAGDLGSVQEEALQTIVGAAMAWDETSGYGSVEASRSNATGLVAVPSVP